MRSPLQMEEERVNDVLVRYENDIQSRQLQESLLSEISLPGASKRRKEVNENSRSVEDASLETVGEASKESSRFRNGVDGPQNTPYNGKSATRQKNEAGNPGGVLGRHLSSKQIFRIEYSKPLSPTDTPNSSYFDKVLADAVRKPDSVSSASGVATPEMCLSKINTGQNTRTCCNPPGEHNNQLNSERFDKSVSARIRRSDTSLQVDENEAILEDIALQSAAPDKRKTMSQILGNLGKKKRRIRSINNVSKRRNGRKKVTVPNSFKIDIQDEIEDIEDVDDPLVEDPTPPLNHIGGETRKTQSLDSGKENSNPICLKDVLGRKSWASGASQPFSEVHLGVGDTKVSTKIKSGIGGRAMRSNRIVRLRTFLSHTRADFLNHLGSLDHWKAEKECRDSSQSVEEYGVDNYGVNPWLRPFIRIYVSAASSVEKYSPAPCHLVHARCTVLDVNHCSQNEVAATYDLYSGQEIYLCFPMLDTSRKSYRLGGHDPMSGALGNRPSIAIKNQLESLGHLRFEGNPVSTVNQCEIRLWWPWFYSKRSGTIVSQALITIDRINVPRATCLSKVVGAPQTLKIGSSDFCENLIAKKSNESAFVPDGAAPGDDGWSELSSENLDLVTGRLISRIIGKVECVVLRDSLTFDDPSVCMITDTSPPASVWSSVLLSRYSENSTTVKECCELRVPPQYVNSMMNLLNDDSFSTFIIRNVRQIGLRYSLVAQEADKSDGEFPSNNVEHHGSPLSRIRSKVPTIVGKRGLYWSKFLAQRCDGSPIASVLPILLCGYNTSANLLSLTGTVFRSRSLFMASDLIGGQSTTSSDCTQVCSKSKTCNRVDILCRVVHFHEDLLFVLDASFHSKNPLRCLLVVDERLRTCLLEQFPKGYWMLCRDALLWGTANLIMLDFATTIEKVKILKSSPANNASKTNGSVLHWKDPNGKEFNLNWIRQKTIFCNLRQGSDNLVSISSEDLKNESKEDGKKDLDGLVNGRSDGRLQVPILSRSVEVPASFDASLYGNIPSLSEYLLNNGHNSLLCSKSQSELQSQIFSWVLLNINGTIHQVGIARKKNFDQVDKCQGKPPSRSFDFVSSETLNLISVGDAMEMARAQDTNLGIAVVLRVENDGIAFIRTRYHDLLRLVGHAKPNESLFQALRNTDGRIALPCLVHASDLTSLRESGGNNAHLYLVSLALLDEQNRDILV